MTEGRNDCDLELGQILGRKVVIWYDKEAAAWRTFLDMCPHRLASLSEGRIDEQGCIQCCYHGWSFKGDGSCARIPQAQGEGPEAKAARNDYFYYCPSHTACDFASSSFRGLHGLMLDSFWEALANNSGSEINH